jgi:hypothetical protein
MPKPTLKSKLAAATKLIAALRKQLAEQENHAGARSYAEGKVRRLEEELAKERSKRHALEAAEAARTMQRPLSDAELMGLAATVLAEHGPKTPTQQRLTAELERRGVVPSPRSPWADAIERMKHLWMPATTGAGVVAAAGIADAMAMKADETP